MAADVWPLYGLRITTPRLELRLPDLPLLQELARVAAGGIHDRQRVSFTFPWADGTPRERARTTFQHVLMTIALWRPERWGLSLAVLHQGAVVGRQDLYASDFARTREARTGSWLGLPHHGRGIGTEMRAAVLHLAFACLEAERVVSSATEDNKASLAVSRKLGYRPDGVTVASAEGRHRTLRRLCVDRAGWEAHRTVPVEVEGLQPCRELFGVEDPALQ